MSRNTTAKGSLRASDSFTAATPLVAWSQNTASNTVVRAAARGRWPSVAGFLNRRLRSSWKPAISALASLASRICR